TPQRVSGMSYVENTTSTSAMQSVDGSTPQLASSGFGTALATLNSNGRQNETNPYYRAPRNNRLRSQSQAGTFPGNVADPSTSNQRYNGPTDYTREGMEDFSNIALNDMNDEITRVGYVNPAFLIPGNTDSVSSDPRQMQDYTKREADIYLRGRDSDFYYGLR